MMHFITLKLQKIHAGKLTFDGFTYTNGFHPLWLLFILPINFLVKLNPENYVKVILLIQLILCFISIRLLYNRIKTIYSSATLIIIFGYFFFKFTGNYLNGLESSLLFFLYTLLFCYCFDKNIELTDSKENYMVLGILSGLIVLTRLDQIFLVSSFIIYILVSGNKPFKYRLIDAFRYSGGFLCFFIPYLIFNLVYFDSIMPISGRLKSTFPHISLSLKLLYDCLNKVTVIALLSILWITIAKYKNIKYAGRPLSGIIIIFGLTVLSHFLHTVFFMNWAVFSWHYSLYIFFIFLVFLEPIEIILVRLQKSKRMTFAVIIFLIINAFGIRDVCTRMQVDESSNWRIPVYHSAVWAKQNSNINTVFAMSDAGIFSYFSERRVINLDGLVNNLAYQDVLKKQQLKSYLKEREVEYIVQHSVWDQTEVTNGEYKQFENYYISRLYEGAFDYIILEKKDEVYRSDKFYDGPYKSALIILKFNQNK